MLATLSGQIRSIMAIHAYNTGLAKGKAGIYKDEIIAILKFLKLGHTVRQTANQLQNQKKRNQT